MANTNTYTNANSKKRKADEEANTNPPTEATPTSQEPTPEPTPPEQEPAQADTPPPPLPLGPFTHPQFGNLRLLAYDPNTELFTCTYINGVWKGKRALLTLRELTSDATPRQYVIATRGAEAAAPPYPKKKRSNAHTYNTMDIWPPKNNQKKEVAPERAMEAASADDQQRDRRSPRKKCRMLNEPWMQLETWKRVSGPI